MRRVSQLAIAALIIGSLLRFANLEGKIYWHDETYTALYATGHGREEAQAALFDGQIKSASDVLAWQTAEPNNGLVKTWQQLAEDDSQHPPLYYLLTRLAMYVTSNTVVATRVIAAIAGILLIPAIYWLSLELFGSKPATSLSAALVAVSPFQYLYAQEAREYSMWALAIALTSATLLKALRKSNPLNWLIYAATLTAGLYTCILTFLVIASHSLYVIWRSLVLYKGKRSAHAFVALRNFTISTIASLLLFLPWLTIITKIDAASWTAKPMPFLALGKIWAGNITRLFFDLNLDATDPIFYTAIPVLLALGLVSYTLIWSIRRMPISASVFLGLLGGVTLLAFVGPDLLFGGRRSSVSRYFIPVYLCLQIAIAYLLAQKISNNKTSSNRKQIRWQRATAGLLIAGLISCLVSIPSDTWWHKKNSHLNPEVAQTVNQAPNSLLISSNNNANLGEVFSLSHRLSPDQKLLLFEEPNLPTIPSGFESIFVFNISADAKDQLSQTNTYQLIPAYEEGRLWKIQPTEPAV